MQSSPKRALDSPSIKTSKAQTTTKQNQPLESPSKKLRSQASTPKQFSLWASPPKCTPKCLYANPTSSSPRRVSPRKRIGQETDAGPTTKQTVRLNGHSSSKATDGKSPQKRKTTQKNVYDESLQDLDLALDQLEKAQSEEDEILSSLLKENQTPQKVGTCLFCIIYNTVVA